MAGKGKVKMMFFHRDVFHFSPFFPQTEEFAFAGVVQDASCWVEQIEKDNWNLLCCKQCV